MSFFKHIAFSLAIFCSIGATSASADTMRIGWTTSDGEKDPYAIMARALTSELKTRMPGVFDVALFPNNQIGDEKQMLEGLQFGTLDIGIITNATIANVEGAFQLNDMPFLFANEAQAHSVLDGDVGQEMLAKLGNRGMKGLGFAEGGFRNMINNTRPIVNPGDVSGVKFRTMQNPVFIDMFKALGGNPTPMAWSETFTAAQQGTIDGLEIPLAVIYSNKFSEVAKYLSLTKHTYSALGVIASKKMMNKLNDKQKIQFQNAVTAAVATQRSAVAKNTDALVNILKDAGMSINEIKDAAAFRKKVLPVYGRFKSKIGDELFNKALAQVQG